MVREEKGAFAAFKYSEKKLIKQIEEIAGELDIKGIFEGEDGERFKKMLNWWVHFCFLSN